MKKVYPLNGWQFVWPGIRSNTQTGEAEADTGHANLEAWFSATDRGSEINADVRKSLTERSATPGEYFAIVSGVVLEAQLYGDPSYDGQVIWEVFSDGGEVTYSVPRRVVERRRP